MNEKRQDTTICRTCKYFKEVNDPDTHDGKWHWGIGVYCSCHGKMVPWSKEHVKAVSVEEFEQATIHFAPMWGECPQHDVPDSLKTK